MRFPFPHARTINYLMDNAKFENWLPLESNCELLNNYLDKLGVDSQIVNFADVLAFEKDFLPQGAVGTLFVYPDSKFINNYFFDQGENMFKRPVPQTLYYMKQVAENACGTIALLHIIANIVADYPFILKEESFTQQFLLQSQNLTPDERAEFLKNCKIEIKKEGKKQTLAEAHKEAAKEGVQEEIELKAGHHFISFVWHKGSIYELDGRKKGPINYLDCPQDEFMEKVAQIVVEHYISKDEKEIGFNLMALQVGF